MRYVVVFAAVLAVSACSTRVGECRWTCEGMIAHAPVLDDSVIAR